MGSQRQDHFCDLERKRDQEGNVHTTHTGKSQSQVKATSLMRRMPEICSWKLIIWREAYATNVEGELLPTLITLPMMIRTLTIDRGQRLPLTSLSHMMKTTAMNAETEIHLREAWEMTLWVKHSTKFPSHLSHVGLREGDFLGGSLNPHSPCIMEEQTLWSMLAISIKGWLYIPKMRPWCARYSHPA